MAAVDDDTGAIVMLIIILSVLFFIVGFIFGYGIIDAKLIDMKNQCKDKTVSIISEDGHDVAVTTYKLIVVDKVRVN